MLELSSKDTSFILTEIPQDSDLTLSSPDSALILNLCSSLFLYEQQTAFLLGDDTVSSEQ